MLIQPLKRHRNGHAGIKKHRKRRMESKEQRGLLQNGGRIQDSQNSTHFLLRHHMLIVPESLLVIWGYLCKFIACSWFSVLRCQIESESGSPKSLKKSSFGKSSTGGGVGGPENPERMIAADSTLIWLQGGRPRARRQQRKHPRVCRHCWSLRHNWNFIFF